MDSYTTLQRRLYTELNDDDGTVIRQTLAGSPPTMYPLVGDPAIGGGAPYSGLLEGGLYDRPIKATGPGNTEDAFFAPAKQIRPCGFVRAPRRQRHQQTDAVPGAYQGVATIYLYADRSATGRSRLELACIRIRQLTDGWRCPTDEGYDATFQFLDWVEPYDTEEFVGAIATYVRLAFKGIYANEV